MNKKLFLLIFTSSSFLLGNANEEPVEQAPCYCGPLFTKFFVTLKGGASPTFFADRENLVGVDPTLPNPLVPLKKIRKFNQTWKQPPFIIGFDLGLAICCNVELFSELNFARASGKQDIFQVIYPGDNSTTWDINWSPFQTFGGYLGLRGYSRRYFCNRLSLFFGTKIGLLNHKKITAQPVSITLPTGEILTEVLTAFQDNNVVAGGIQIGFDAYLCRGISLFLNAETLASCGLRSRTDIQTNNTIFGISNYVHGGTGTIISFPINIGLRYYFG